MDDVDAVQGQIARNMLHSGDWVSAQLDGVKYLEKSPLKYWMMAVSMAIFGEHDWAARLPIAFSTILLCWLVTRMAGWAMGPKTGFYAGLSLTTCLGLWLFTRILIPDVVLTLAIAFVVIVGLLVASWGYPTPGDISTALTRNPGAYTLSLGHMGDLTVRSFAYLRLPLAIAGLAMLVGAVGTFALRGRRAALSLAVMMILFFQAARVALIAFDPYLGSYPLAQALNQAPAGGLIVDDPYYEMSGLFFYTNRSALILNGRKNNLEYGSYAPGAPPVFIGDAGFVERWNSPDRWYVASEDEKRQHLTDLVGAQALHPVAGSGGKTVYTNH